MVVAEQGVLARGVLFPKSGPRKLRVAARFIPEYQAADLSLQRMGAGCGALPDLPSRLADRLACTTTSTWAWSRDRVFSEHGYTIVSDACIACRGPVLSVKLLSRVPIHQIRSLALDEGSRTSVALVQMAAAAGVSV